MTAPAALVALIEVFVNCFTTPGFQHFYHFMIAHACLWGAPHCVTETMRLTRWHARRHWTTPYKFMNHGRWSCRQLSATLLGLLMHRFNLGGEMVVAIDDTLVKKWGRGFFGLGTYPDPTDKNPGAGRRRVWGHCWVVLALLWQKKPGAWFCFPLATRLFVPQKNCPTGFAFRTKIELAVSLIRQMRWKRRLIVVVDNLYAKAQLLSEALSEHDVLISRLRSNAALYDRPAPRRKGQRGRPPVRGKQVTARHVWSRRRSGRKRVIVRIYGKRVRLNVWTGVLIPSRTLGNQPVRVVILPQRTGQKMNIFFSTDTSISVERLLELYAARFKIEDCFDELKTHGGFADCRQRSFTALRRHATLCLVAYSLLRVLTLTVRNAQSIEAEPWWHPAGPPSVTRVRRALAKAFGISLSLHSEPKVVEIQPQKLAA